MISRSRALARRGILPRISSPTKSKSFLYPLVDCARQYIRHLKSAGQQDRDRYWKARAKSEKEKAHALSIANGVRNGHLVYMDQVEAKQREMQNVSPTSLLLLRGAVVCRKADGTVTLAGAESTTPDDVFGIVLEPGIDPTNGEATASVARSGVYDATQLGG